MDTKSRWTRFGPQVCALGESPFWHPVEQSLYWVDIHGKCIYRANGYTGDTERWDLPETPGCIAPAASGGLVIALRNTVYRASQWKAPLERIHCFEHDAHTTRFNDGKCDPHGRFWAGTMYEPRDQALGQLFSLEACAGGDVIIQTMADGATVANGLAWSPDASTVYWTDTKSHCIRAWDWQADANVMSQVRTFAQFAPKPEGWRHGHGSEPYGGRPDGAAVDVQGNYWVAMYEGGRILKLSPTGEQLAELRTPVLCPTMPCFGGDDLKTLYFTSASHGRGAAELAAFPHSGCVFFTRVDVPGLPVNLFCD